MVLLITIIYYYCYYYYYYYYYYFYYVTGRGVVINFFIAIVLDFSVEDPIIIIFHNTSHSYFIALSLSFFLSLIADHVKFLATILDKEEFINDLQTPIILYWFNRLEEKKREGERESERETEEKEEKEVNKEYLNYCHKKNRDKENE